MQCKEILCLTELLMALWEKAFDTRPDLSLIPGTNITERTGYCKLSLASTCVLLNAHTDTINIFLKVFKESLLTE